MFGARFDPKNYKDKPPQWAVYLVKRLATAPCKLYWAHHPKGRGAYGCAYSGAARVKNGHALICIHTNTNDAGENTLMVLLHEIAHINTPGLGHEKAFWDVALGFYKEYGLLSFAAYNEGYATGRKLAAKAAGIDLPKKTRRKRVKLGPLEMLP